MISPQPGAFLAGLPLLTQTCSDMSELSNEYSLESGKETDILRSPPIMVTGPCLSWGEITTLLHRIGAQTMDCYTSGMGEGQAGEEKEGRVTLRPSPSMGGCWERTDFSNSLFRRNRKTQNVVVTSQCLIAMET